MPPPVSSAVLLTKSVGGNEVSECKLSFNFNILYYLFNLYSVLNFKTTLLTLNNLHSLELKGFANFRSLLHLYFRTSSDYPYLYELYVLLIINMNKKNQSVY